MTVRPTTVVFDIGNVLVAWDPRNLYRRYFEGREEQMEWFLSNVCTPAWNVEQDRGRSFADAVELLVKEHPPELHPMIRAFDRDWQETISGPIHGSVDILKPSSATTSRSLPSPTGTRTSSARRASASISSIALMVSWYRAMSAC